MHFPPEAGSCPSLPSQPHFSLHAFVLLIATTFAYIAFKLLSHQWSFRLTRVSSAFLNTDGLGFVWVFSSFLGPGITHLWASCSKCQAKRTLCCPSASRWHLPLHPMSHPCSLWQGFLYVKNVFCSIRKWEEQHYPLPQPSMYSFL